MAKQIITSLLLVSLFNLILISNSLPVLIEEDIDSESEEFLDGPVNISNLTNGPKDLYVIRTTVYEVGILTEAGNDTDNSTDTTNEEIDLTFFNPIHKGGKIDLSHIPAPIQTNISGVTVTGIAALNFGSIDLSNQSYTNEKQPKGVLPLSAPILPNALITVTHNVSTLDAKRGEELLSDISPILGFQPYANVNN